MAGMVPYYVEALPALYPQRHGHRISMHQPRICVPGDERIDFRVGSREETPKHGL
eukprot:CAMPEP_0119337392 /NCGR_PEP_ID=MMETSP1333-20130426/93908_1 /TAXON_ID=418940 /ORGANISM="Scyphosphaera apsteinii, Strain RCC1455" /LENGTH=54 /DNA_ID=CAMNT_0007348419 /DNA_START=87 /DNA_END=247 /DNA_ORIENTATION=+